MIAKITAAYIRHYRDNGQRVAYAEWIDGRGKIGRTEGNVGPCPCCGRGKASNLGAHMQALFDRAKREGITVENQSW